MCTVTLTTNHDGWRLLMNRDEQHQRSRAHAPQQESVGVRQALLPRDPDGGGTWVGVNDAGLAFALLNLNEGESTYGSASILLANEKEKTPSLRAICSRSRGSLIPALLAAATLKEVQALFISLHAQSLRPFRLIATDGACALTWHSRLSAWNDAPIGNGLMWTSSGLGDEKVEAPRRILWEKTLRTPAAQAQFHTHQWTDAPELSVCMSRADARTVSLTQIEVQAKKILLHYFGEFPLGHAHTLCLERA